MNNNCKWCPCNKVNSKPGKPFIMARGIGNWELMCKKCYERRKDNPFLDFKSLQLAPSIGERIAGAVEKIANELIELGILLRQGR